VYDDIEISRYESLVTPDNFEINNTHINNITTEKATNEGKPINEVLNQLSSILKDKPIIVGHNI
jgi:DNA polymerase III epsilon subunit-like protein